jgi:hypothetical protein
VKGGLQFLEQVASIFQGRLEGVKGDEVTQEQEKADTELSVVLAQIDSGLHSWWFRHVELLCHTGQEGEQLHLQHPQQESHALPLTEHVQGFEYFHGCGEGGEQGGGVEGWPGGDESSQFREETGRWLEDRKRAWGRGDTEISKKLFVTGSESQNVRQVKSFISHSFHSCRWSRRTWWGSAPASPCRTWTPSTLWTCVTVWLSKSRKSYVARSRTETEKRT